MFFSRSAKINLFSTTHLKPTKSGREYKAVSAAAAAAAALAANRVETLQSRVLAGQKRQRWQRQNGTDALEAVVVIALINILCCAPQIMEEERRRGQERWGEEKRAEEERQSGVKGWCINLNARGWSSRRTRSAV